MNIDINKIIKNSENIKIRKESSYIQTYQTFINYFKSVKEIKKSNLIIGSHFVYGWMPTVLYLKLKNEKVILNILNRVKKGYLVNEQDLELLKSAINNSMVGVSKLLHFINPRKYAIWDSVVYKYIFGKNSNHRLQKPKLYLEYLSDLDKVSKNIDFKSAHKTVEKVCGYKVSPMRAAELIMFESRKR